MMLLINEVETSKCLELSESKKNVLPVTNINIVKYSASFSTEIFIVHFLLMFFRTLTGRKRVTDFSGIGSR